MNIFFYILCSCCFACTTLLIGISNPIHSILLLIAVFAMGSLLLFMLNVEFFAIIFLIVYVGAIAVLFLFIIMMLDIKVINTAQKVKDFFSYRNIILVCLLTLLLIFLNDEILDLTSFTNNSLIEHNTQLTERHIDYSKIIKFSTHLEVLGQALFKEYIFPFLLCSFILLIAMVGAIVVTIEDLTFKNVKQQNLISQGFRTPQNAIFNFKIYKKRF
mgnify:CR=1 FL=1